jgi:transcriptional regulator with XRE-family HTH domain
MSIAVRRSVGRQLQHLRQVAGKSVLDVAATKIVSKTTLMAIEAGERGAKIATIMALGEFYTVDRDTRDQLIKLTLNREKGWWEDYSDVLNQRLRIFIELESAADRVHSYDSELVYGILQTPAYHRAVFEADPFALGTVDREVQFRIDRQKATLERDPPLRVVTVMNEAVLAREVGGASVMAEQHKHLRMLNRLPNVDLYVLPWNSGAHAAMSGPFKVVSFDAPDNPDVVYLETSMGVRYVEDVGRLAMYQDKFDLIRTHAVNIEEFLT